VGEKWEEILNTDTYNKHVRIETPPDQVAENEEDREFHYKSNLKLRPEHLD